MNSFGYVKETPCPEGTEEILVPGELECRTTKQRERNGFMIFKQTWNRITTVADELDVEIPGVT